MSKIINFPLEYHSIGPSALVIGSVTEKCDGRMNGHYSNLYPDILQLYKPYNTLFKF